MCVCVCVCVRACICVCVCVCVCACVLPTPVTLVLPTPIRAGQLSTWLEGFHQADRGTLVRGFQVGFDVGYDGPHRVTQCADLKSALELPHIIDNKIKK